MQTNTYRGSEQTLKVQPQVSLPPQVTPSVTLMDPDYAIDLDMACVYIKMGLK